MWALICGVSIQYQRTNMLQIVPTLTRQPQTITTAKGSQSRYNMFEQNPAEPLERILSIKTQLSLQLPGIYRCVHKDFPGNHYNNVQSCQITSKLLIKSEFSFTLRIVRQFSMIYVLEFSHLFSVIICDITTLHRTGENLHLYLGDTTHNWNIYHPTSVLTDWLIHCWAIIFAQIWLGGKCEGFWCLEGC